MDRNHDERNYHRQIGSGLQPAWDERAIPCAAVTVTSANATATLGVRKDTATMAGNAQRQVAGIPVAASQEGSCRLNGGPALNPPHREGWRRANWH